MILISSLSSIVYKHSLVYIPIPQHSVLYSQKMSKWRESKVDMSTDRQTNQRKWLKTFLRSGASKKKIKVVLVSLAVVWKTYLSWKLWWKREARVKILETTQRLYLMSHNCLLEDMLWSEEETNILMFSYLFIKSIVVWCLLSMRHFRWYPGTKLKYEKEEKLACVITDARGGENKKGLLSYAKCCGSGLNFENAQGYHN